MLSSRWIVRQPLWVVQSVGFTIALVLMLYAWGGLSAVRNLVLAWFVAGAWGLGINLVGQQVGWSRVYGELDMLIASPITPRVYLAGVLIGSLLFMPFALAAILAIALLAGCIVEILVGMLASMLLLPVAVSTGLAIVMRIRGFANISAITNTLSLVLQFLPPVFYPATIIPRPFRIVTLIIPTSAAAEFARSIVGLNNVYSPLEPLTALLAWLLASMLVASRAIKWGLE